MHRYILYRHTHYNPFLHLVKYVCLFIYSGFLSSMTQYIYAFRVVQNLTPKSGKNKGDRSFKYAHTDLVVLFITCS